ncbi:N-acetylmuramoyl-L-alanine amidase, partial [Streptomyces brasiliscabiei]
MAEYPGAARAGVSPNRSDRQGKVRLFIVHHYAGTQDPESAWKRFMSSNDRSVSPNYQVNADGSVFEIVPPDRFRAWTTGTIDHQAVTCETQNTSGAPTWGISRESHEAIAHLIAWAAQRYGFPIQRGQVDDGNVVEVPGVVGHRETPAGEATGTACPGPSMDLDWIVSRARQIASGSPAGAETKEWDEMATKDEVKDA